VGVELALHDLGVFCHRKRHLLAAALLATLLEGDFVAVNLQDGGGELFRHDHAQPNQNDHRRAHEFSQHGCSLESVKQRSHAGTLPARLFPRTSRPSVTPSDLTAVTNKIKLKVIYSRNINAL